MEERIFRYGAPGKLDTAPFGTECYVAQLNKPNEFEIYKQYSNNEEEPNWIFVEYKFDRFIDAPKKTSVRKD